MTMQECVQRVRGENAERWANPTPTDNPITDGIGNVDAIGSFTTMADAARGARTGSLERLFGSASGLRGVSAVAGVMGLATGGYHLLNDNPSQGVLDAVSGAGTLAALAVPALGTPAAVLGAAAYGNERAQAAGWYGQEPDATGAPRNASFFSSIENRRRSVTETLRERLDPVTSGQLGNYVAGGQAVANLGAATFGGLRRFDDTFTEGRVGCALGEAGRQVARLDDALGGYGQRGATAVGDGARWAGDRVARLWSRTPRAVPPAPAPPPVLIPREQLPEGAY